MRKILLAVLALAFAVSAATTVQLGDTVKASVGDVDTIMLHDASAASVDTFDAGECCAYGPYSLTNARGNPMYKGFQLYAKAITGTSPTMNFAYQLITGTTMADTMGLWTVIDTLDGTGANAYVDLSDKAGRAIVFRVYNYDGTECQIPNVLGVMRKHNTTVNLNK